MIWKRMVVCVLAVPLAACMAGEFPQSLERVEPPSQTPWESEQWYFWTEDGVRHYAFELGPAGGAGDPAIVLHGGWGAEHSYLVEVFEPLADRFRFVLYDQRGSLRSAAPDSTLRIEALVSDLEHLRISLGRERVVLIGHSMGNALIYAYLSRYPQHVKGVVLLAPVHPARYSPAGNMAFVHQVWPDADSTSLSVATQEFFADAQRRAVKHMKEAGLLPPDFAASEFQGLGHLIQTLGLTDRDRTRAWRINFASVNTCDGAEWPRMGGGMVYYSQATANAIVGDPSYSDWTDSFWPALQRFPGPVSVIIGTCDYVDMGPMIWPHVVRHLGRASLEIVDGAGHALWMDDRLGFGQALEKALMRLQAASSQDVESR